MMPPSPRLLARRISVTYLSETTIIKRPENRRYAAEHVRAVNGMPWSGLNVSFAA
jgi:hypothetical protein